MLMRRPSSAERRNRAEQFTGDMTPVSMGKEWRRYDSRILDLHDGDGGRRDWKLIPSAMFVFAAAAKQTRHALR